MKKTLSLFLALAMSLALVVPAVAANTVTISEEGITVTLSDVISYEDVKVCFPDAEGDDPNTYYLYCDYIRIYHLPSNGVRATMFNNREDEDFTSELNMMYEGYLLDPNRKEWVYLNDDAEDMTQVRVPYPACVPLVQIDDMDEDFYIYGQVNSKPVQEGELSEELPLKISSDLGKFVALSVYVSEHSKLLGNGGTWPALTIYCAFDDGKYSYKDNAVVSTPSTPSQPQQPTGIKVSDWAKDQVARAGDMKLIPEGLGDNYQANITRAQFAAATVKLYAAMSGKTVPAAKENPFTDTKDPAVLQAAEMNFVSGMGDGTFAPDALVTREQAASMLARVYEKLGGRISAVTATSFADNSSVSAWARNSVAFMSDKGIVSGVGNNRFDPQGSASIEQALSISLRMLENLK